MPRHDDLMVNDPSDALSTTHAATQISELISNAVIHSVFTRRALSFTVHITFHLHAYRNSIGLIDM